MLTTVFALEGRVRPFNKWLRHELARHPLEFEDLAGLADAMAAEPTTETQRDAFRRLEIAARSAGQGPVIDSWEPDVAWLRGGPG
jgi:hypothetical protein